MNDGLSYEIEELFRIKEDYISPKRYYLSYMEYDFFKKEKEEFYSKFYNLFESGRIIHNSGWFFIRFSKLNYVETPLIKISGGFDDFDTVLDYKIVHLPKVYLIKVVDAYKLNLPKNINQYQHENLPEPIYEPQITIYEAV